MPDPSTAPRSSLKTGLMSLLANTPVSNAPTVPPTPCTPKASSESSYPNRAFTRVTMAKQTTPATSPMSSAGIGPTNPVAGLVAITPASGFVGPMPALLIGLVAGVVCCAMVTRVKARFGYDDSLDAFGVHGIGGTVGALLTGVFASKLINPCLLYTSPSPRDGLLYRM